MKQKAFVIIFKGLTMKQIKQIFLEGESPTLILTISDRGKDWRNYKDAKL